MDISKINGNPIIMGGRHYLKNITKKDVFIFQR